MLWSTASIFRNFRENELVRYRAEKVGFVFQQFHLVPYLTALET